MGYLGNGGGNYIYFVFVSANESASSFMLVKIAAQAGAKAGATLGANEAFRSGAKAGALAGAAAGQKAGAEAGAEAATKAATEIATNTLKEALANMSALNKPVGIYVRQFGCVLMLFRIVSYGCIFFIEIIICFGFRRSTYIQEMEVSYQCIQEQRLKLDQMKRKRQLPWKELKQVKQV